MASVLGGWLHESAPFFVPSACCLLLLLQEYWVTLPQDPTTKQLQLLHAGTGIDGVQVVPKFVKILQSSQQSTPASGTAAVGAGAASKGGGATVGGRGGGRSSRRSSNGSPGDGAGRCIVQLDVSEGKKHEVGF